MLKSLLEFAKSSSEFITSMNSPCNRIFMNYSGIEEKYIRKASMEFIRDDVNRSVLSPLRGYDRSSNSVFLLGWTKFSDFYLRTRD